MPLVRIDLRKGRTTEERRAISSAVHEAMVFIQICISVGRTVEIKKSLFKAIADRVSATGVRREDVFIGLIETERANWSFGNGLATYAPK